MSASAEAQYMAWRAQHPDAVYHPCDEILLKQAFIGGYLEGVNFALLAVKEKTTHQSNG